MRGSIVIPIVAAVATAWWSVPRVRALIGADADLSQWAKTAFITVGGLALGLIILVQGMRARRTERRARHALLHGDFVRATLVRFEYGIRDEAEADEHFAGFADTVTFRITGSEQEYQSPIFGPRRRLHHGPHHLIAVYDAENEVAVMIQEDGFPLLGFEEELASSPPR